MRSTRGREASPRALTCSKRMMLTASSPPRWSKRRPGRRPGRRSSRPGGGSPGAPARAARMTARPSGQGPAPADQVHPRRPRAGERLGRGSTRRRSSPRGSRPPFRAASLRRSRRSALVIDHVPCRGTTPAEQRHDARPAAVRRVAGRTGPIGRAGRGNPRAGTSPAARSGRVALPRQEAADWPRRPEPRSPQRSSPSGSTPSPSPSGSVLAVGVRRPRPGRSARHPAASGRSRPVGPAAAPARFSASKAMAVPAQVSGSAAASTDRPGELVGLDRGTRQREHVRPWRRTVPRGSLLAGASRRVRRSRCSAARRLAAAITSATSSSSRSPGLTGAVSSGATTGRSGPTSTSRGPRRASPRTGPS